MWLMCVFLLAGGSKKGKNYSIPIIIVSVSIVAGSSINSMFEGGSGVRQLVSSIAMIIG